MAHAQQIMDDDTAILDREAQVRLRQMTYRVEKAYPKLAAADAEALAVALIELFDENKKVTPSELRDRLQRQHDAAYADRIVAAISS